MPDIRIERLTVGQMQENCYLVTDSTSNTLVIIDPGDDGTFIAEHVEKSAAKPVAILATHGHFDHILAAFELQALYSVPFCMNSKDAFLLERMKETASHFLGHTVIEPPPVISRNLSDGDEINLGDTVISVAEVPGHTPGSLLYLINRERVVFSGDLIFENGSVGRTDFSYSDRSELQHSLKTLLTKPGDTIIYPGHGNTSTISKEAVYYL